MSKRGNFKSKKAAQSHAARLRREIPRLKPVRVVKVNRGWDVLTR